MSTRLADFGFDSKITEEGKLLSKFSSSSDAEILFEVGFIPGLGADDEITHEYVAGGTELKERDTPITVLGAVVINEFGDPKSNIPERPFMRNFAGQEEANIMAALTAAVAESLIAGGTILNSSLLERKVKKLAKQTAQKLRTGIESGGLGVQDNAARTIARKGSKPPLVNSGKMSSSVAFKKTDGEGG